jgi:hypothetical protein
MARVLVAVLILAAAALPRPVSAHHALASEYDPQQRITLKAKLVEVDWRNPHPFFHVEEEGGSRTKWIVAAATTSMLTRFPGGWTRTKVLGRVNEVVTVVGWKARDGSNRLYGDMLTFADGQQMKMGIGLTGA